MKTPNDDEERRRELLRVAMSDPQSGREAIAKVTALRTLDRLDRRGKKLPPCPPDWHPGPPELEELDREYLKENPECRQRLWEHYLRSIE